MLTVAKLAALLEVFAPLHLAESWDNVGLLLGDREAPVLRVMTCLTVTPESAAEAVEEHADLVVSHHPILFHPVQRLTTANPEGQMLLALVRAGVAVYSPHTAFDNARQGINVGLARRLGLVEIVPLRAGEAAGQSKVVVFVPLKDFTQVADAMFEAGAGRIGEYSQCSFRIPGTGTFFGSEATNPTVGQKGRRVEVEELRLEVICPDERLEPVLSAMRRSHSYEEPAFDVYPLRPSASTAGQGRVGCLPAPLPLGEFAAAVKQALGARAAQVVGSLARLISRVAIACGAGGEFLADALRCHADVLLTGEMRFHDYLTAEAKGIALVLPGHYATERPGVEELAEHLQKEWPELHVWASRREHDPVTWK